MKIWVAAYPEVRLASAHQVLLASLSPRDGLFVDDAGHLFGELCSELVSDGVRTINSPDAAQHQLSQMLQQFQFQVGPKRLSRRQSCVFAVKGRTGSGCLRRLTGIGVRAGTPL